MMSVISVLMYIFVFSSFLPWLYVVFIDAMVCKVHDYCVKRLNRVPKIEYWLYEGDFCHLGIAFVPLLNLIGGFLLTRDFLKVASFAIVIKAYNYFKEFGE